MENDIKMVIVARKDLNMRKGKLAAQTAHAAMHFLQAANRALAPDELHVKLTKHEIQWFASGTKKIVVSCEDEKELEDLIRTARAKQIKVYSVTDSGHTEFHGVPTVTCAAFGPAYSSELDSITGALKLL